LRVGPLTDAELAAKFHDCAARVLPATQAGAILAAINGLDTLVDTSTLARLLAPPA
jgi:hypothetical protein